MCKIEYTKKFCFIYNFQCDHDDIQLELTRLS